MEKKDAVMTFWLLLSLLFCNAISASPTPPSTPQPVAFRVGSLRFDRPESWQWVKPSGAFRAAQLEKKAPDGTPLVITFSRFPAGEGGSVQANIDRWISQFTQTTGTPEVISHTGTGCPFTLVRILGTMKGGVPGGPAKDLSQGMLRGAILEADGELVMVKLAGPDSAVRSCEKDFEALISAASGRNP
jgi:hypothetical protein